MAHPETSLSGTGISPIQSRTGRSDRMAKWPLRNFPVRYRYFTDQDTIKPNRWLKSTTQQYPCQGKLLHRSSPPEPAGSGHPAVDRHSQNEPMEHLSKADLLRLRLHATCRDNERLRMLTCCLGLTISSVLDELTAEGWNNTEATQAVIGALVEIQEKLMSEVVS